MNPIFRFQKDNTNISMKTIGEATIKEASTSCWARTVCFATSVYVWSDLATIFFLIWYFLRWFSRITIPHTEAAHQLEQHDLHSNNLHFWRTCQQSKLPFQTCNQLLVLQGEQYASLAVFMAEVALYSYWQEIHKHPRMDTITVDAIAQHIHADIQKNKSMKGWPWDRMPVQFVRREPCHKSILFFVLENCSQEFKGISLQQLKSCFQEWK